MPPGLTVGVPQFFVILIEHTGKLPKRKSLSVEVVDWEERVSSKKLAKHGTGSPKPAKAAVMSTPPSKNSGEASVPPL